MSRTHHRRYAQNPDAQSTEAVLGVPEDVSRNKSLRQGSRHPRRGKEAWEEEASSEMEALAPSQRAKIGRKARCEGVMRPARDAPEAEDRGQEADSSAPTPRTPPAVRGVDPAAWVTPGKGQVTAHYHRLKLQGIPHVPHLRTTLLAKSVQDETLRALVKRTKGQLRVRMYALHRLLERVKEFRVYDGNTLEAVLTLLRVVASLLQESSFLRGHLNRREIPPSEVARRTKRRDLEGGPCGEDDVEGQAVTETTMDFVHGPSGTVLRLVVKPNCLLVVTAFEMPMHGLHVTGPESLFDGTRRRASGAPRHHLRGGGRHGRVLL